MTHAMSHSARNSGLAKSLRSSLAGIGLQYNTI
jgi:hypothetical protein